MANVIDIFLFLAVTVGAFLFVLPAAVPELGEHEEWGLVIAGVTLAAVVALTAVLQYPFLKIHQTIGKAFFGLKIVTANEQRPLTVSIIIQRELFGKVMPVYLLCLPVFFGKTGHHDIAAETKVVRK